MYGACQQECCGRLDSVMARNASWSECSLTTQQFYLFSQGTFGMPLARVAGLLDAAPCVVCWDKKDNIRNHFISTNLMKLC